MPRPRPIIGKDRESHQRDLYEIIEKGDFPKWTLAGADHARGHAAKGALQTPST